LNIGAHKTKSKLLLLSLLPSIFLGQTSQPNQLKLFWVAQQNFFNIQKLRSIHKSVWFSSPIILPNSIVSSGPSLIATTLKQSSESYMQTILNKSERVRLSYNCLPGWLQYKYRWNQLARNIFE